MGTGGDDPGAAGRLSRQGADRRNGHARCGANVGRRAVAAIFGGGGQAGRPANRPGKEAIADGLQKCGANRAHNQKAGAEERVCETAQEFETLKEMLVASNIL